MEALLIIPIAALGWLALFWLGGEAFGDWADLTKEREEEEEPGVRREGD